ncbi:GtrA family protein [Legionella bozemanae]|uniref:GtrA family protein n=1 Tax=Legionella bozemanae TaxID=447 RepID=UPI003EF014A6
MKIKFIKQADKKQMLGFAITGILSTLIMFGLYVMLYQFINYQYAYLIAYTISVVALYFMNKSVFKGIMSLETILEFPLIYLLQYVLGALSLEFIVWLGFSATYAPLIIVIILLPVTFILNRIVFSKHKRSL